MISFAKKDRVPWLKITVWTLILLSLIVVYAFLGVWYVIIFAAFGLFTIPWRLLRRSKRKSDHTQRAQLALMQQQFMKNNRDDGDKR